MKTLIAACLLLALASPGHAETCTGRVGTTIETGEGLFPKGAKVFSVGGCTFGDPALQKRVLRTCPLSSRCRVEGSISGDADIETITSVTKKSEPIKCNPVPMDGKGWLGVGGWKYASKSCAMGPRVRPKDRAQK